MLTSDNPSPGSPHLHTLESQALFSKFQAEAPMAGSVPTFPGELGFPPFSRSSSGQNKASFQIPDNAIHLPAQSCFGPWLNQYFLVDWVLFPKVTCRIFPPLLSCLTPLSPGYVTDVCSLLL